MDRAITHADYAPRYLSGIGAEIGAHTSPISGISPIYVDKFSEYDGVACLADYPGEATALPFFSNSLDYVASSHVFEHLANPVKALVEWQRVLKPGGHAYLVVPDRRYTFEHARETTAAEHMIGDYLANVDDNDTTHIDEFVYGIDWEQITPGLSAQELNAQQQANAAYHHDRAAQGLEVNIHFHVFEPTNFKTLIELCNASTQVPVNMELIAIEERFPEPHLNGFLAVLRTTKSPLSRLSASLSKARKLTGAASEYPLDKSRLGTFKQS